MSASFYRNAIVFCVLSVAAQFIFNTLFAFPIYVKIDRDIVSAIGLLSGFLFAIHSYFLGTFFKNQKFRLISNLTFIYGGVFFTTSCLLYIMTFTNSVYGLLMVLKIAQIIFIIVYPISILAIKEQITPLLKRYANLYLTIIALKILITIVPFFVPIYIPFLAHIIMFAGILVSLLLIPVYQEAAGPLHNAHDELLDIE